MAAAGCSRTRATLQIDAAEIIYGYHEMKFGRHFYDIAYGGGKWIAASHENKNIAFTATP